jgi:membrane associated rhomboid family serine protease
MLNIINTPVFTTVTMILFATYVATARGYVEFPCTRSPLHLLLSNFVHTDITHITVNLVAFYYLATWETRIGSRRFATLLCLVIAVTTLYNMIFVRIFPDTKCSVGFSAVIMGLFAWDLIVKYGADAYVIIAVLAASLLPVLVNRRISWKGHLTGAIAGFTVAALYNPVDVKDYDNRRKDDVTIKTASYATEQTLRTMVELLPILLIKNIVQ